MRGNMKLPLAAALLILFPSFSNAQEKGVSVFKSFDYVKSDNPWLVSPNTASLYTLSVKNISTVNVGMTKSDGSYMDVHESGNAAEAGAYTESYVKVSDRMAFSGKLSYSYFTGSKMCGPVLMDPSYNFINFEESTTDNPGRKSKEVFDLSGGINYRLGDIWSIGGKLSYNTANYSKLKDPRFASKWADFGASLGIASKLSDKVTLGIDGEFRKTVVSITALISEKDPCWIIPTDTWLLKEVKEEKAVLWLTSFMEEAFRLISHSREVPGSLMKYHSCTEADFSEESLLVLSVIVMRRVI